MLSNEFLALSQRIGSDPLLVQGPGGNTSVKSDGRMQIKASGTELSDATVSDIFVEVDVQKALLELDGAGDGSCRAALANPDCGLRPSIETTFHAMFPQRYVFHFHSVNTICHAISVQGRERLTDRLQGLKWVSAPYRKPGIPLSLAIRAAVQSVDEPEIVEVIVLDNHGIIIVSDQLERIRELIDDVESRLQLPVVHASEPLRRLSDRDKDLRSGWSRMRDVYALSGNSTVRQRAVAGSYYPDHVVFLGPGLPFLTKSEFQTLREDDLPFPAAIVEHDGVYLRDDASPAHRAMLHCIHDVLVRIPSDWELVPIGVDAEAELLNWDAEKYRQQLAERAAQDSAGSH